MKLVTHCVVVGLIACASVGRLCGEPDLVVHESGILTALQDESGKGIGGINTAQESLPEFIYQLTPALVPVSEAGGDKAKGAAQCHADVTMLLERSGIYFYKDEEFNARLDVEVRISRGWLTEFYPNARVTAHGLTRDRVGPILAWSAGGSVYWRNVALSASEERRPSLSNVWLAPRAVESATVEVRGEHEKFLFARGVANMEAPLRVVRSGPELQITSTAGANIDIRQLWLVDVQPTGAMAFRVLQPFNEETAFVVRTAGHFAPADYSRERSNALRDALQKAFEASGLFEDEAAAQLATWQASDFQSPGLRLLFLIPQDWTQRKFHLRISSRDQLLWRDEAPREREPSPKYDVEVNRVLLGRIEIVTPERRRILAELAGRDPRAPFAFVGADPKALKEVEWEEWKSRYDQLGRFRNALVLDEQRRRPSDLLQAFIKQLGLQGYEPPRDRETLMQLSRRDYSINPPGD